MLIELPSEQDRITVAAILVKHGYTVRIIKRPGKNKSIICVEAWKGESNA